MDVVDVVQERSEPAASCLSLLPHVSVRERCARLPGSVSGARYPRADFPCPAPFPPPSPPPVSRPCSTASRVLRSCLTSHGRSSSAYAFRLPDAVCGSLVRRRQWDLPVPEQDVSEHVRGLRPRGAWVHLAIAVSRCGLPLPATASAPRSFNNFAARYPTCSYPCQRFAVALTSANA